MLHFLQDPGRREAHAAGLGTSLGGEGPEHFLRKALPAWPPPHSSAGKVLINKFRAWCPLNLGLNLVLPLSAV